MPLSILCQQDPPTPLPSNPQVCSSHPSLVRAGPSITLEVAVETLSSRGTHAPSEAALLSPCSITKVQPRHNLAGLMLVTIKKESDYTPEELQESASTGWQEPQEYTSDRTVK